MRIAVVLLVVLIFRADIAAAALCYGGRATTFVNVEICDADSGYCLRICFTPDAWKASSGMATLARYMFAVGNGVVPLDEIEKEAARGFSVGRDIEIGNIWINPEQCVETPPPTGIVCN